MNFYLPFQGVSSEAKNTISGQKTGSPPWRADSPACKSPLCRTSFPFRICYFPTELKGGRHYLEIHSVKQFENLQPEGYESAGCEMKKWRKGELRSFSAVLKNICINFPRHLFLFSFHFFLLSIL